MAAHIWLFFKLFNFAYTTPTLNLRITRHAAERISAELINKLQTTLQPEQQLSIFKQHVCRYLPLCGVIFKHQTEVFPSALYQIGAYSHVETLSIDGMSIGQLELEFEHPLQLKQKQLLQLLMRALAPALKNALEYQAMKMLALTDNLTGLANRNQFDNSFKLMVSQCQQQSKNFALMVIDLDNFKWINDQFGHQMGDLVLKTFGQVLKNCSRENDFICRFGGDEFTLLLKGVDDDLFAQIANRICIAVEAEPLLAQFKITCSIGCAYYCDGEILSHLFERADKALYRSKAQGKNCFTVVK